jgi:hypothetical protein
VEALTQRAQGRVGGRPRKHLPLVEVALKMLDEGATYEDVRAKLRDARLDLAAVPGSTQE